MPKSIRTRILCALLALLLVSASRAQDAGPSSSLRSSDDKEVFTQLVEQIKQLQQQDHDLEERIKALEARQPQASPTAEAEPASSTVTQQSAEQTPAAPTPTASALDGHDVHGIQVRGFGEVDYQVLNQRQPELGTGGFVPGSWGNFYSGDFGLFLTARLTAKASVLSEVVFEEGDAQRYTVDLRRMLLKYDYNDHLKMSSGRYQTNIGYYNWAFRSAAWLQTTADRPLVMQYSNDGGLLPTQAVGVSVTARFLRGS